MCRQFGHIYYFMLLSDLIFNNTIVTDPQLRTPGH